MGIQMKYIVYVMVMLILLVFSSFSFANVNEDLLKAAYTGNLGHVKEAIANGANINAKGGDNADVTALMLASHEGFPDIVRYLIEKGANINEKKKDGVTALMFAVQNNHMEIVKLLLEYGSDINITPKNGDTALMNAIINSHDEIAYYLIEKGANVNTRDKKGKTPLMIAAENGSYEIVRDLIKKGANKTIRSAEGKSVIDYILAKKGLRGLKFKRIDKETILITDGFPYQKEAKVGYETTIHVKDVVKGVFNTEGAIPMGYEYAIGITWIFDKPFISFNAGIYKYTSKYKGALIKFTDKGVSVKGFEIINLNDENYDKIIKYLQNTK